MVRIQPLMLLLALALFLAPNAAAVRFRPRRHTQVSVSSDTQVNGNDSNTTTTAGEEEQRPAGNTTLPAECEPVSDKCMDSLASLAETAHNETALGTDKDTALEDYCATECGQKYVGKGWGGRVGAGGGFICSKDGKGILHPISDM